MNEVKKYKVRTKPEPFFVLEIKGEEKIDINKILKGLPKETTRIIDRLEEVNGEIKIGFKTQVKEFPRFESKERGVRINSFLDISDYDFETCVYPLLKNIFEANRDRELFITCNMLQMTGLYMYPNLSLSWKEQQLANKMYADTYRYIFSLSTINKNSVKKEWRNFIQSLEKLGGLPEGSMLNQLQ